MTKIIGILNITPDSFSDGGKFNSLDSALSHLQKLLEDGADMIDIGAESTRPGSTPLTPEEEWLRLEKILPEAVKVVKNFTETHGKKIETSIDSYHFETVKKAYQLGIDVINDVSGLADEKIVQFIAEKNIQTVLMHNAPLAVNSDLVVNPYQDTNQQIIKWVQKKISDLKKHDVKKSQLIFDPGVGFNKNAFQSIQTIKFVNDFRILDLPIYIGHSKKSFLEKMTIKNLDRAQKTLEISKYLIGQNVDYLRVHDVKEHKFLLDTL
jgi:dihydropteroate synthase